MADDPEKIYEDIVTKRNIYTQSTLDALKLVHQYILDNNRILVGGMSIDFALKLKGARIYGDDCVPDYDFLSPNYWNDAYNIANLLSKSGFKTVSVVNAMHTSTMRVLTNYVSVADATYMPQNLYDKLETLKYKGLRIIHPTFQFTDQHISLTYPYSGDSYPAILHRWKKDMERHDKLYNYYPIDIEEKKMFELIASTKKTKTKNCRITTKKGDPEECHNGIVALLYWYSVAQKKGFQEKLEFARLNLMDEKFIDIDIPEKLHVAIFSDHVFYDDKLKSVKQTKFNALGGKLPRKIIFSNQPDIEFYDNYNSQISAHKTEYGWFCDLQPILVYFLTYYWYFDKYEPNPTLAFLYQYFYLFARQLVEFGTETPTWEIYGSRNCSENYLLQLKKYEDKIHKRHDPSEQQLQPKNVYLENGATVDEKYYDFDPTKSPILQIDGKKIDFIGPK